MMRVQDAIGDAFRPFARDGAALPQVQIRLQKALTALPDDPPGIFVPACLAMSREAIERADPARLLPGEMAAIRSAAPDPARIHRRAP